MLNLKYLRKLTVPVGSVKLGDRVLLKGKWLPVVEIYSQAIKRNNSKLKLTYFYTQPKVLMAFYDREAFCKNESHDPNGKVMIMRSLCRHKKVLNDKLQTLRRDLSM